MYHGIREPFQERIHAVTELSSHMTQDFDLLDAIISGKTAASIPDLVHDLAKPSNALQSEMQSSPTAMEAPLNLSRRGVSLVLLPHKQGCLTLWDSHN